MEVSLQFMTMLTLLIVGALVLPWIMRWLSRKRGSSIYKQKAFVIQEVFALDPKKKLFVFDYETTRYLVILGPDGDTLIDARPLMPPTAAHDPGYDDNQGRSGWAEPRL